MTPADGSDYPHPDRTWSEMTETRAILLHGGRTLLLAEGMAHCLPTAGTLLQDGRDLAWHAMSWQTGDAERETWCGIAVLDALPLPGAELHDAATARSWRFAGQPAVDVTAHPLAGLVRRAGVDCRDVFNFLSRHLLEGRSDSAEAKSHRDFAHDFFTEAAERDGFIEILAAPECGGVFAQGWSMSLDPGAVTLASVGDGLAIRKADVATFGREDILAPGRGICFFCKDWQTSELMAIDAVFFERGGRLLRLDVVKTSLLVLERDAAVLHVRNMLDRLEGPEETRRRFRRICRPRFGGENTLAGTSLPIAAAFDTLLQAPGGALLATGWLLDPMHRIDRVLLKSTGNLYAPLDQTWCALPRPDINEGFAADPRFADLLGPGRDMHGFIVHVEAERAQVDGHALYLELVLDDDSCLFLPLNAAPFTSSERLPQVLSVIPPGEPELGRIVEDHLAPFLETVAPASRERGRGRNARLIPLGAPPRARTTGAQAVSAVMPFRTMAELQPVFGILAASEEARALELILVTTRATASEHLQRLEDAFRFYGLSGGLVIAAGESTLSGRADAAVSVASGERILCWLPEALPKHHGWLAALLAEAERLPRPGLVSPALTYEDDSIYFGGGRLDEAQTGLACGLTGYGAGWLPRGLPEMVASGAPEIALIERDLLERAGGFTGRLFSDSFAHVDLAARLRRLGSGAWCAGAVEFWKLDDTHPEDGAAQARIMKMVDSALIARRRNEAQTGGISR